MCPSESLGPRPRADLSPVGRHPWGPGPESPLSSDPGASPPADCAQLGSRIPNAVRWALQASWEARREVSLFLSSLPPVGFLPGETGAGPSRNLIPSSDVWPSRTRERGCWDQRWETSVQAKKSGLQRNLSARTILDSPSPPASGWSLIQGFNLLPPPSSPCFYGRLLPPSRLKSGPHGHQPRLSTGVPLDTTVPFMSTLTSGTSVQGVGRMEGTSPISRVKKPRPTGPSCSKGVTKAG